MKSYAIRLAVLALSIFGGINSAYSDEFGTGRLTLECLDSTITGGTGVSYASGKVKSVSIRNLSIDGASSCQLKITIQIAVCSKTRYVLSSGMPCEMASSLQRTALTSYVSGETLVIPVSPAGTGSVWYNMRADHYLSITDLR